MIVALSNERLGRGWVEVSKRLCFDVKCIQTSPFLRGGKKKSFELFSQNRTVNQFTGSTADSDSSKVGQLKDADRTEMVANRRSGF